MRVNRRKHLNRVFYNYCSKMAARSDDADAANQPMTHGDMIRWLIDQVFIAEERGVEYDFFTEALGDPRWKEILTALRENGLSSEEYIDAGMFTNIVASAKNLEQVQWITEYFGITADVAFADDGFECNALKHAVWALDFPMVEWLITHFGLDSLANVRDEVARAIDGDSVMSSFAMRTVVIPDDANEEADDADDADSVAQDEMTCLLKKLFKL
jgi:hypothetical protein